MTPTLRSLISRIRHYSYALFKVFLLLIKRQNRLRLIWAGLRIINAHGLPTFRRSLNDLMLQKVPYEQWIELNDTLTEDSKEKITQHIEILVHRPLISILMPTYNTPEIWLQKAINSIREQLYPYWELCIADDASTEPHVQRILEEYRQLDQRIRIVYRNNNGHISAASNSCLELAQGEFVALFDHDDELPPHALYLMAISINEHPSVDLIYSDEDKIDETGRRFDPYFKPDWNPDLLTAQNTIRHLAIYRREIVQRLGGFRQGVEGAQDWDLALRVSEEVPASHIHHIPHILYHWRTISGSTATNILEKPYVQQAAIITLQDHLQRTGQQGYVEQVGIYFKIRYQTPTPLPLVSVIIPTHNGIELLQRCIESLQSKTEYNPFEIIVVDNRSDDPKTLEYLNTLEWRNIAKVIKFDQPFNYSSINNYAATYARGKLLCLMNNDIEIINKEWLSEMVSQAVRQEIGVVGAMLYYPNDTIQHAGVVIGMGGCAGHLYIGCPNTITGYFGRAQCVQNLSAVTAACLVVRKKIFDEVNGLDAENLPIAYNDIDFCLRVMELGYRNLWTPFAKLYHHESATRGPEDTPEKQQRFQAEQKFLCSRWSKFMEHDPAYNPNLTLSSSQPQITGSPRNRKPWEP